MPRNKHPEETVQKILDVSLKLFMEQGYENTTVLDIVKNLGGLTRGAFYHHFKSKEEVLSAVLDKIVEKENPFLILEDKNVQKLNGREKLILVMKQATPNKRSGEHQFLVGKYIDTLRDHKFLALHLKQTQESAKDFVSLFAEGMEDGSIRPGNPKVLADLLMLLINIWLAPSIYPGDFEEWKARADTIFQIFEALGCPINEVYGDTSTEEWAKMLKV